MAYNSIHTAVGLAALAAAEVNSTVINLPTMAVGDGNGSDTSPSEAQTTLVREVYRAAVNRVYQAVDDPTSFTAELVIPASVGGFTIREVGVFDASGSLFVVGNLPATYKPSSSEGAYADTIVRLTFKVGNASLITVQIDPNVAVASQTWVLNNVTGATVIPGGNTGQVLTKASNADGDTVWSDPDTASVVVDTLEEHQDLVAGQTVIDLVSLTTRGLAVYIDGERIANDQWTADLVDNTKLTLSTAATAGQKLIASQNEPTGSVPFPLVQSLNLSDVPDKATARTNLDVYSKAEAKQLSPAGNVSAFARSTAPTGWLKANGAAVSRTAYADLFAAIGTTFGSGDGFTTFNLPDFRGEFIRGWDDSRGIDASRALGSSQAYETAAHMHYTISSLVNGDSPTSSTYISRQKTTAGDSDYELRANSTTPTLGPTSSSGGSETRPRNIALLICIKY